jgi:hypothetical protein
MEQNVFEELTNELAGWTIVKWDGYDETGEAFRLIVSKDGIKKLAVVVATDLGMNLETVRFIDTITDREMYTDLEDFADMISDHIWRSHDKFPYNMTFEQKCTTIIYEQDIENSQIGYKCQLCNKEWWITLDNIASSNHLKLKKIMQQPDTCLILDEDNWRWNYEENETEEG